MLETTLTGKTPDIAEENIKKLKAIFPEVITEGKLDIEKLRQVLGEYVEDSTERYNFSWNGKGQALRISQTPSLGTLRPCKEESKNWDATQNLYIEGDNLEVLKLLQKSYYGKIKMIYIDPPYNTGGDFVYPDDYRDSLENYRRVTGQVDGNGKPISTNTEASGRYHTNWLNMMYPRLRLARNLLRDDGVIFISIDDNEVHNLRKICDEIFGEDNFIANCVRKRRDSQANLSQNISPIHEYVIIYAKQFGNILNKVAPSLDVKSYKNPDNDPRGPYTTMPCTNVGGAVYSIVTPTGATITDEWRFKRETFEELLRDNRIVFPRGGEGKPRYKIFLSEKMAEGVLANTWFDNIASNQEGTRELKELFGGLLFNNPKPTGLIKFLLELGSDKDSIILDFFSGSATTTHAVMQLNAEDGGNRRVIMVQLPEPIDENSEAFKSGYKNIAEIGKERIRRAGEKIKEEIKDTDNMENLDIGFKVFKLDTSNIRKWQPDYDNLEQSILDYVDNFVEGRTELDVVYEIMLKYGLDLAYPVDEFTVAGKKVYSIGYGMLMICFDDEITTDVAKGILAKVKELSPESSRVVFKDNGFKTDSNKTNIKEILKSGGIEEFITI